MKERSLKDYGMISLKGIAMGSADVVPGVSGGTIAFIVGIYDELLDTIKTFGPQTFKLLFTGQLRRFWQAINGNFLFSLVLGIAISIFSLARVITYLLEFHPVLVWSFFFGLVMASAWLVSRDIARWDWKSIVSFVIGTVVAYYITVATPAETPDALWFIFICGAIAICAMILPGISGSFILVLLGKYFFIMEAVKTLNIKVILVFLVGAAIGITSFSHLLSYSLKRFHDTTLAVLAGFMLGSLNKVWPWKTTTILESDGMGHDVVATANIMPNELVWQGVLLIVLGLVVVLGLDWVSKQKGK